MGSNPIRLVSLKGTFGHKDMHRGKVTWRDTGKMPGEDKGLE